MNNLRLACQTAIDLCPTCAAFAVEKNAPIGSHEEICINLSESVRRPRPSCVDARPACAIIRGEKDSGAGSGKEVCVTDPKGVDIREWQTCVDRSPARAVVR